MTYKHEMIIILVFKKLINALSVNQENGNHPTYTKRMISNSVRRQRLVEG